MNYSCAGCRRHVSGDQAFLRSVNFRTVAWCSPCWRDRHADQLIPVDRPMPADAVIPAQRRAPREAPDRTDQAVPRLRLLRRVSSR
jgi:hypothetical protein